MTHEKIVRGLPGLPMLFVLFAELAGAIYLMTQAGTGGAPYVVGAIVLFVLFSLMMPGFFLVEPNGSKVILLFGRYVGTVKEAGFHFVNPFTSRRNLSLRVRTLNGEKLKVNDSTAIRLRLRRSSYGKWMTPTKPALKLTTTRISSCCRAKPQFVTPPVPIPTTMKMSM